VPYGEDAYDRLRQHGMFSEQSSDIVDRSPTGLDDLLSKHIAHLFIRDPLVIFSETLNKDDSASNDHFEVRF
jgi:glutamate--cysteine ligase catalytic subunit